jgi:hypothetical protein
LHLVFFGETDVFAETFSNYRKSPIEEARDGSFCFNRIIDPSVPSKGRGKGAFQTLSTKKKVKRLRKSGWYRCFTCDIFENEFLCCNCARSCHSDHKIARVSTRDLPNDVDRFICACDGRLHESLKGSCFLEHRDKIAEAMERNIETSFKRVGYSHSQAQEFVQQFSKLEFQEMYTIFQ